MQLAQPTTEEEPLAVAGAIPPEKQKLGQARGHESQSNAATQLRVLWWKEAVRLIMDGYDRHLFLERGDIIEGLRQFNLCYQFTGKRGRQIKRSTIARWFSGDVRNAIFLEAVSFLIQRGKDAR